MSNQIALDEQTAKDVLASTLLAVLTPEKKDEMLRAAIIHVLQEKDRTSYSDASKLQNIFKNVVYDYAHEHVKSILQNDAALKAQLDSITRDTIAAALDSLKEAITEGITATIKAKIQRGY